MDDNQSHTPDAAQQQAWEALWRRLLLPNKCLFPPNKVDEQEPESAHKQDISAEFSDANSASQGGK